MDQPRLLTLSVGTGVARLEEKYDSKQAAKWGIIDWMRHGNNTPLFEILSQASADMVDFHTTMVFQALYSEINYLRIQVYILSCHTLNYLSTFFTMAASSAG